jgi:hypothetical protein
MEDIESFYREVLIVANEAVSHIASQPTREHYNSNGLFHRPIQNMFHFIECRNIISWVIESIEAMETASYCGAFISILVIDKSRPNVARLLPIQCSKIKQLATTFETCLSRLIGLHPSTVLFDREMGFANEVTNFCRDLLSELSFDLLIMPYYELWRCAVHVLDMAVLSYAGAHTQLFGESPIKYITLPGPFLEEQYFMFRRRSFNCLGEFLRGEEAWVLEWYHPDAPQLNLPPLCLATDATTFGDIWGPMWKSCALVNGKADYDHILRYNVGNGSILPWNLPSPGSEDWIRLRKNEVFCHWISDKEIAKTDSLVGSSGEPLPPDDILLIGANTKLQYNSQCNLSTNDSKQRLRDSGSLSELGTMRNTRFLDSEALQIQVGGPYAAVTGQRIWKMRGRTWKEAWTENWKNNPESRDVKMLEFRFGVEVSACTYNARRRRLVTLLGSNTMMNYLRNGSLSWNSTECKEKFCAALKSSDHRAFRNLYMSQKDWQPDLGKAITYCLDGLMETGTNEEGLNLLWVPDAQPGQRASIKFREHSWAGFLKDTEDCCTMAALENKCLEFPNLAEAKKCQNQHIRSGLAIGSKADEIIEISVLETSFMLNQNSVPKAMCKVPCRGPHGSSSPHKYRWSTSSLEEGEKFYFGQKGQLKYIKSLGNSQILASWKSSEEVLEALKQKFQRRGPERMHREYIRDEKGGAGPIDVLVLNSESEKIVVLGESPVLSRLGSGLPYIRQYTWASSKMARPRNSDGTTSDEIGQKRLSKEIGEGSGIETDI